MVKNLVLKLVKLQAISFLFPVLFSNFVNKTIQTYNVQSLIFLQLLS